jgi:transcriptional regulator with XRE-family HTH domain
MGKAQRPKPLRLAAKLTEIRLNLDLSQNEMIRRLGLSEWLTQAEVSAFERGVREPPLPVLLQYARVAGVPMDMLVDDALELPNRLPASLRGKWSLPR